MILDFLLHIDSYLLALAQSYGTIVYLILFVIIFLETGLVFTPFLPGDSLIFASGALSSQGFLNVFILFFILCAAAIIGDTANYLIGRFLGSKIQSKYPSSRNNIEKAENFYDKYGNKTIILARFIPIIRTFAPFIAGIGKMKYSNFLAYNIIGGIIWVALFLFSGFFFGNMPVIKNNLSFVIIVIIILSVIPVIVEYIKRRKS